MPDSPTERRTMETMSDEELAMLRRVVQLPLEPSAPERSVNVLLRLPSLRGTNEISL